MEPVLAGLFVFAMRLTDMSLDTLRLLFVMRGRKLLSAGIGAIQATVFILAVSAVLSGPLNVFTVAAIAKDTSLEEIFKGALPFLIAMLFVTFLITLFPQIALYLPGMMGR